MDTLTKSETEAKFLIDGEMISKDAKLTLVRKVRAGLEPTTWPLGVASRLKLMKIGRERLGE